jgi:predicted ribosomally synthesized peptide with SipW-like signal peptide
MSLDDTRLSRRRLLGAVGTVGAAATLGGASSLAVFTDEETFANNQLTAGELDLEVGWAEYYSDWSPDESVEGVTMSADGPVFANESARAAFRDATRQERFPEGGLAGDPCAALGDVPDDLDAGGEPRPLLDLGDVKPGDAGAVAFDLALCDNPGYLWLSARVRESSDAGFTEPERTDPDEYDDVDLPTEGSETVLALENDRLTVLLSFGSSGLLPFLPWTYAFPDGTLADVLFSEFFTLQDGSASGDPAASTLTFVPSFPSRGVPGTAYDATATGVVDGATVAVTRTFTLDPVDALLAVDYEFAVTDGGPVDLVVTQFVDYDLAGPDGDTATFRRDEARGVDYVEQVQPDALGTGEDLYAGFGAARQSDAHDVGAATGPFDRVIAGAALAGGDAFGPGDPQFALEYALGTLGTGETATLSGAFALARSPQVLRANLLKPRLGLGGDDLADAVRATVWHDTDRDGVVDPDEPVAFEGSLAQLLALASTGSGLALAGDLPAERGGGTGRPCFAAAPTVHDLRLRWELPVDHANELQSDALAFDLGLYAEQCRHNDGTGGRR